MSQLRNYYEILEVPKNASSFEIEQAYQKLSTYWHPDKHKENRTQAEKKFDEVAEAYDVLSNRNSRLQYDQLLQKQYSIKDAHQTFEKFFQENGYDDESEKSFFNTHYPKKQRTYYDVLEIPRNASMDEIKKAYRKLALKYHPKNNPENETAQKRFVEVNEAYNALNSEIRRQNYDNILYREMVPTRAHNIFEDFMGDRFFNMPSEEQFFKPIIKKKWSRNLDNLMQDDESWRKNIDEGETMKSSSVYQNKNGVESKKTVTTQRKVHQGKAKTYTTEEYEFPNGTKQVRKIVDDGFGNVETKIYNLRKGESLPIEK